ncbi:MAG TPA: hypothetical protein VGN16_06725 [Acidobacteriaceae bacterium]|jgi:hypothetical protein
MNTVCRVSNTGSDIRCAVCGQGFLVDWTYKTPVERAQQFAAVLAVLRKHHHAMESEYAHPAGEFCLCMGEPSQNSTSAPFPEAIPVAA